MKYQEGVGIKFTELLEDEHTEKQEGKAIPDFLSGQETADLVAKVFGKLRPNFSEHLVDSNVVLTLAGFKPQTDFFIELNIPQDRVLVEGQVEGLNAELKGINPEIKFQIVGLPFEDSANRLTQMVSVENLLGVERVSKVSKIPGVESFNRAAGWRGLSKWHKKIIENFEFNEKAQTQPFNNRGAFMNVLTGLYKGYPDTAIYDFAEWSPTDRSRKMQGSNIPYAGTYKEDQPNYSFYPEHANNLDIQENIKQAGKILEAFYESDWHKKMSLSLKGNRSS